MSDSPNHSTSSNAPKSSSSRQKYTGKPPPGCGLGPWSAWRNPDTLSDEELDSDEFSTANTPISEIDRELSDFETGGDDIQAVEGEDEEDDDVLAGANALMAPRRGPPQTTSVEVLLIKYSNSSQSFWRGKKREGKQKIHEKQSQVAAALKSEGERMKSKARDKEREHSLNQELNTLRTKNRGVASSSASSSKATIPAIGLKKALPKKKKTKAPVEELSDNEIEVVVSKKADGKGKGKLNKKVAEEDEEYLPQEEATDSVSKSKSITEEEIEIMTTYIFEDEESFERYRKNDKSSWDEIMKIMSSSGFKRGVESYKAWVNRVLKKHKAAMQAFGGTGGFQPDLIITEPTLGYSAAQLTAFVKTPLFQTISSATKGRPQLERNLAINSVQPARRRRDPSSSDEDSDAGATKSKKKKKLTQKQAQEQQQNEFHERIVETSESLTSSLSKMVDIQAAQVESKAKADRDLAERQLQLDTKRFASEQLQLKIETLKGLSNSSDPAVVAAAEGKLLELMLS
ncbi:hypothetical protein P7C70_g6357, partial [Phenoliferia sp. Uapishka_3]